MMTIAKTLRVPALSLVLTGACLVATQPAHAADKAAGEKLAKERCAACHGQDFKTAIDPSYPKLAGQHADYLIAAMKAYGAGDRKHARRNAIMAAQATGLSATDRENLAAYFESLPGDFYIKK